MDPKLITPILMVVVVAWAVYRRVRRTIGRQPYQPKRMQVRMGFLAFVGVIMLLFSLRDVELAAAAAAGIVAGAALGFFGLRHTKFENTPQGRFYTPHLYIGLLVTVLLLGRLAYQFIYLYPTMHAAAQSNESPFASFQKSPLTLAVFGIVIGYYVAYYAGVIREMKRMPALAATPAATESSSM